MLPAGVRGTVNNNPWANAPEWVQRTRQEFLSRSRRASDASRQNAQSNAARRSPWGSAPQVVQQRREQTAQNREAQGAESRQTETYYSIQATMTNQVPAAEAQPATATEPQQERKFQTYGQRMSFIGEHAYKSAKEQGVIHREARAEAIQAQGGEERAYRSEYQAGIERGLSQKEARAEANLAREAVFEERFGDEAQQTPLEDQAAATDQTPATDQAVATDQTPAEDQAAAADQTPAEDQAAATDQTPATEPQQPINDEPQQAGEVRSRREIREAEVHRRTYEAGTERGLEEKAATHEAEMARREEMGAFQSEYQTAREEGAKPGSAYIHAQQTREAAFQEKYGEESQPANEVRNFGARLSDIKQRAYQTAREEGYENEDAIDVAQQAGREESSAWGYEVSRGKHSDLDERSAMVEADKVREAVFQTTYGDEAQEAREYERGEQQLRSARNAAERAEGQGMRLSNRYEGLRALAIRAMQSAGQSSTFQMLM